MKDHVWSLVDAATKKLHPQEVLTCRFSGEDSDFCRFNKAKVRQVGKVLQGQMVLNLISNKRQISHVLTLGFDRQSDLDAIERHLRAMREALDQLPEDPYILYNQEPRVVDDVRTSRIPPAETIVSDVLDRVGSHDFVGLYSGGFMARGFASSLGQRSWYQNTSFNLDWSLYLEGDNAAKYSYGGFVWDVGRFENLMADGARSIEVLRKPRRTIEPGKYRVYLAPAALAELVDLLSWSSFGIKSQRSKHSSLIHLAEGTAHLSPLVSMIENTAGGAAPNFDENGFMKPASVGLVQDGRFGAPLVSARSSREYGVPSNGANQGESPESLDLAAGILPEKDALKALGTGLYINNLWYCNYSDRVSCRITGMTRFATFWVEDGKIVAPVRVMRFDDTIYNVLGKNLEALTKERSFMLSTASYGSRSTGSHHLPGALVRDFQLTL